ncbi:MAG: metallophosphoesterase [Victivallaceae bacterium]
MITFYKFFAKLLTRFDHDRPLLDWPVVVGAVSGGVLLLFLGYCGLHDMWRFRQYGAIYEVIRWAWIIMPIYVIGIWPNPHKQLNIAGALIWNLLGAVIINLFFDYLPTAKFYLPPTNYIFLGVWSIGYIYASYLINYRLMLINAKRKNFPMRTFRRPGVYAILATICAGFAGVLYMYFEAGNIKITQREIVLQNWPQELDGIQIAVISDLHWRENTRDQQQMEFVISKTNAAKVDLIFLLGDYVGVGRITPDDLSPRRVGEIFGNLRAKYGVFAVLGNHDYWRGPERISRALTKNGVVMVENNVKLLEINGTKLALLGLSGQIDGDETPVNIMAEYAQKVEAFPCIVLAHSPDYFGSEVVPGDLMLSGHLHGGQFNWPLFGPLLIPSAYGNRFLAGEHTHQTGAKLFVSRGIGCDLFPMRLNAPPEVVILTLRSGAENKIF